MNQLRAVGDRARADLGLSPEDPLDTSAEATANRIADFALGFFDQFAANHPELEGDELKSAFIDLVGGAVQQGVDEALGILEALSALNPEVDNKVETILEIINQRFEAYLNGGE